MRKRSFVALLILGATILGATALREPVANAAQLVNATIVGPLDQDGNVKVHEQGVSTVAAAPGEPLKTDEVDTPAIEPWQRQGGREVSLAVPAGRLAVVDYVSGRCFTDFDSLVAMQGVRVTTTEDGHEVEHWVPSSFPDAPINSSHVGVTGQMVRIYADGGTTITAVAVGDECEVGLSGHLEE